MSLPRLITSPKSIPIAVSWTAPDSDDGGYSRFLVPLEISGITESGLVLSGGTFVRRPDRNVSFELSIVGHEGHRRIPLSRVEWRSLTGGHSNQRRYGCEGPWAGKRVPNTHIHTFEGNWLDEKQRMRKGDLPCAEPIDEELQSFESLRSWIGRRFNINNIEIVPRPNWDYDLFE